MARSKIPKVNPNKFGYTIESNGLDQVEGAPYGYICEPGAQNQ